jgi:ribA/ribD-fused uncharacterized protein
MTDAAFDEHLAGLAKDCVAIGEATLPINEGPVFEPFLKGVFSQWHVCAFEIDGRTFTSAEQWMMYAKAMLFDDPAQVERILATDEPAAQKRAGQRVANFDGVQWDRARVAIVYRGNLAKFSQNPGLQRRLLSTAPALLVEANPRDWNWGCGLAEDDPRLSTPASWPGLNLLGRILTRVREDLS